MHRIPGPNRLSGPAQGDHGFPGVGVYCMSGFGDQGVAFGRNLLRVVMHVFFALCRAKPGALQNSGADQVGSAGFWRRRAGEAATRDGLQQHLRKLLVLPVVLLQGWVSEPMFLCKLLSPSTPMFAQKKWRSWFAVSVEYWNLVAESENHRSVGYWVLHWLTSFNQLLHAGLRRVFQLEKQGALVHNISLKTFRFLHCFLCRVKLTYRILL